MREVFMQVPHCSDYGFRASQCKMKLPHKHWTFPQLLGWTYLCLEYLSVDLRNISKCLSIDLPMCPHICINQFVPVVKLNTARPKICHYKHGMGGQHILSCYTTVLALPKKQISRWGNHLPINTTTLWHCVQAHHPGKRPCTNTFPGICKNV